MLNWTGFVLSRPDDGYPFPLEVDKSMLVVAPGDQATGLKLAEELALVERQFAIELTSDLECVNQLVQHVERYRGKMLRPMLVLVSAMASSPSGQDVTAAHRVVATVVEMVHMATLVHDDILDEAQIRRKGQTVNQLRGNETAVMLGDYLISHAYHLCSSLDTTAASRVIAWATNTVCEGELLQLSNRQNWQLDEDTYYEIIRRKTASLCGVCCKLGSMLHGADDAVSESLYLYGEKLGKAFQIIDDVLDLTGDIQTVGKTLGRDVEKGKLTLPLIHALRTASAARRQDLLAILNAGQVSSEQSERIRQILQETGSLQFANAAAQKLVEEAKAELNILPDTPARACLITMADAVITRQS